MFLPIISPSQGNPYYINTEYGGYNRYTLIIDKATGCVIPNCTAFCFGAFMECCGITACNLPVANAADWYRLAPYTKGQTPALGAIACWKGGTNSQGHVAFVNEVRADGTIVVAESGYYSKTWYQTETLTPPYNRNGLTFQGFIYNPFTDMATIKIQQGEQRFKYLGAEIIVIGQRDEWSIGMLSAKGENPHTALQPINAIDDSRIILYASMNSNYFQMQANQPDPYGEHYGYEISLTNEFKPHKGNVLAYALLKGGKESACCSDNNFWFSKEEVEYACAPAYVPFLNGKRVDLWSKEFEGSKARPTQQSMIIRTKERNALAVCTGELTVAQLTEWAANIEGLQDLCFMDSGGSSQLMIGYKTPVFTGRQIPNVISFFTWKAEEPIEQPPVEEPPTEEPPADEPIEQGDGNMDKDDTIKTLLPNAIYDILKWFCLVCLPACTAFVLFMGADLSPHYELIAKWLTGISTLLGALIGVSTVQYNAAKKNE